MPGVICCGALPADSGSFSGVAMAPVLVCPGAMERIMLSCAAFWQKFRTSCRWVLMYPRCTAPWQNAPDVLKVLGCCCGAALSIQRCTLLSRPAQPVLVVPERVRRLCPGCVHQVHAVNGKAAYHCVILSCDLACITNIWEIRQSPEILRAR